jgi:hypothetical protein
MQGRSGQYGHALPPCVLPAESGFDARTCASLRPVKRLTAFAATDAAMFCTDAALTIRATESETPGHAADSDRSDEKPALENEHSAAAVNARDNLFMINLSKDARSVDHVRGGVRRCHGNRYIAVG